MKYRLEAVSVTARVFFGRFAKGWSSQRKPVRFPGSTIGMLVIAAVAFLTAGPCVFEAYSAEVHSGSRGLYREVISEDHSYRVVKGDTLLRIAGRFGVELDYLLRQNPQEKKYIYPGDAFRVVKRTIVPAETGDGIVVNIPDRMLYLFRDGVLAGHYPVGLGKPSWKTPRGPFRLVEKKKDPAWHVPPSIQREMAENGEEVLAVVPPGPDNPLGHWALRTSIPGILIHETIAPDSVFRFSSHGCIRMRGADAESLFGSVEPGDTGQILYRPVKLAVTGDGGVFLEVHRDEYGLSDDPLEVAAGYISDAGLVDRVDWEKVLEVTLAKEGVAQDVTNGATRSTDGQKRFPESGAGSDALLEPAGGTGQADGHAKHADAIQYPHRGAPYARPRGRDRVRPVIYR